MLPSTQGFLRVALALLVASAAVVASLASPLFPTQAYVTERGSLHQAVADFNGDGHPDIAVVNGVANNLSIFLGRGDGSFVPSSSPATGPSPSWAAAVDLNRDGRADLAVANSGSGDVSILLSRGDGTFEPETRIAAGSGPAAVVAANLNSDVNPDLLVINKGSDDVTALLGRGDGSFDIAPGPVVGDEPMGGIVADFNLDGFVDFAVGVKPNSVRTFFGNGTGHFTAGSSYGVSGAVLTLRSADFNGDGRVDLLAGLHTGTGSDPYRIAVLRGIAEGQFQALPDVSLGYIGAGIQGLDVGDVDGDARMDVVKVGSSTQLQVMTLRGKGDGTFQYPQYGQGALHASSVALVDLDHDGKLDLIEVERGAFDDQDSGRVAVLPGRGDGTFTSLAIYPAGNYSNFYVAAGRFDGDENPDVVLTNGGCCYSTPYSGTATVFINHGDGTLATGVDYPVFAGGHIALGDYNTDGRLDVVLTSGPNLESFHGIGDGNFLSAGQIASSGDGKGLIAGDVNGDGFADLVKSGWSPDGISVFIGRGDGSFLPPVMTTVGNVPFSLAGADFDSDGLSDVAVVQRTDPGLVRILLSRGDGTFDIRTTLTLPRYPMDVVATDLDEDGVVDLAVTWPDVDLYYAPSHVAVFRGRGAGEFDAPTMFEAGGLAMSIAAADMDSDGHLDLVTGNESNFDLSILTGRGDGTFLPGIRVALGTYPEPWDLAIVDMNHDRRPDLVVSLYERGLGVILNSGPFPDTDSDGILDSMDDCTDSDGDGYSDPGVVRMICPQDNCPSAFNPGQEDENGDGAGDACQPRAVIEEIREDGGVDLEVKAKVEDPQNELLRGAIEIVDLQGQSFVLRDPGDFSLYTCSSGHSPDGVGPGIAFTGVSFGIPVLFDLDSILGCVDGRPDFEMAPGACGTSEGSRFSTGPLDQPGAAVCVRRVGNSATMWNWDLSDLTLTSVTVRQTVNPLKRFVYSGSLPDSVPISSLGYGQQYKLRLSAIDGSTPPAIAEAAFVYHGESMLVFLGGEPPVALISAPSETECAGPSGAPVVLDGSGSTGADGRPIVEYTWVENPGSEEETVIGTGPVVNVDLSLGVHSIGLRVKDNEGGEGSAVSEVAVSDTIPPVLDCRFPAPAECTGFDGAAVTVAVTAYDVCSPVVVVTNNRSAGGADASGIYPLGSTEVTFEAVDASTNSIACALSIAVVDTTPPLIALAANPALLWPPNHTLVPVSVTWTAADFCDPAPAVALESVSSSEPENAPGTGDGDTNGDVSGADRETPDAEILLRAEREGHGAGRVYELSYRAVDAFGNRATASTVVTVPHDLGNGPESLLMRLEPDGGQGGVRISWPSIPDTVGYDVVMGDLSSIAVLDRTVILGAVRVLARGTAVTALTEGPAATTPPPGKGIFYLIQPRTTSGGRGYGTEPVPWPRIPASCDGGCP